MFFNKLIGLSYWNNWFCFCTPLRIFFICMFNVIWIVLVVCSISEPFMPMICPSLDRAPWKLCNMSLLRDYHFQKFCTMAENVLVVRPLHSPSFLRTRAWKCSSEQCGTAVARVLILSSSCHLNPFERRIFPVPLMHISVMPVKLCHSNTLIRERNIFLFQ